MFARHKQDTERGASIVEFALVAPVLLMLLLGIVQVGIVLNQKQGLQAAAREGARTASLASSDAASITQDVLNTMEGISISSPIITITPNVDQPCAGRSGQPVTVNIETTTQLDVPFVSGQAIAIAGEGTFRCE